MAKMEIELTEDQLEKVEILKSKDISVGEAIDLLFEVQHEIKDQLKGEDSEEELIEKISEYSTKKLDDTIEEVKKLLKL